MDTDKDDGKKNEAEAKTTAEKDAEHALSAEELDKVSGGLRPPPTRKPVGWREVE